MKDFVKIFLSISALAAAFIFGRGYGEKTFRDSDEYRNFIKKTEEQGYLKSEFENIKAKLQNITDGAENKKTDELLAQILHVFLTDLGLRIQNKDVIIKKASTAQPIEVKIAQTPDQTQTPKAAHLELKTKQKWTGLDLKKYKSYEWMLQNAGSEKQTFDLLKKIEIKNLDNYLFQATDIKPTDFEKYVGSYAGEILNINHEKFAQLKIKIEVVMRNGTKRAVGELIMEDTNAKKSVRQFDGSSFGQNVNGFLGLIIDESRDRFFHLYKLKNSNKLVGNYYENLPGGTTNTIGSFILNSAK